MKTLMLAAMLLSLAPAPQTPTAEEGAWTARLQDRWTRPDGEREFGFKDLPLRDVVRMRIHGVTPEFVKELRSLGYTTVAVDDLVKMRIHGVTPAFIRELGELGYGSASPGRLVEFRIHGVDAAFIKDTRAAGYTDLSDRDLVDMSIHGRRWLRGKK